MGRPWSLLLITPLWAVVGCGPACHEETHCRVFDVLAACTPAACSIQGGLVSGPATTNDLYAAFTISPNTQRFTRAAEPEVVVTISPAELDKELIGFDQLHVEVGAGAPIAERVSFSLAGAQSACSAQIGDQSHGIAWICDANSAGHTPFTVTVLPQYPNFTMRVFYRESVCTGTHTVCSG